MKTEHKYAQVLRWLPDAYAWAMVAAAVGLIIWKMVF